MSIKERVGVRIGTLLRCLRCLDCTYPQKPNQLLSIYHSNSIINQQILQKVLYLNQRGLSLRQIAVQLQHIYGKHILANIRQNRTVFGL